MPGRDTVNQQEKKPFHRELNGGYMFEFSNHWSFAQRIYYLGRNKSVHWNELVLGLSKGMEGANTPDSVLEVVHSNF
ncbi:hypothetical protein CDAR_210531 [Caerostris darwini]|uniref:Uncharacterized protein n=1 Tax=Caerostris darwini TaxID=1538125 RepID=A0AAV4MJU6_9ARAC|nr:hypothetical protein CDAR_210531 [Caerostris darwini]